MTAPQKTADLTRAEKHMLGTSILITYFTGKDEEGREFYVFYALSGNHRDAYTAMIQKGDVDFDKLDQWGKVLAMEYGTPTPEVLEIMEHEYHFNMNSLNNPQSIPNLVTLKS